MTHKDSKIQKSAERLEHMAIKALQIFVLSVVAALLLGVYALADLVL